MPDTSAAPRLRKLEDLRHPPGLPWFGNLFQAMTPRMHLQLEAWAQEYGRLFCVRLPGHRFLAVNDTALAQQILKERPEGYRRASNLELVTKDLMMNGLFSSEGEHWRQQRRIWLATLNNQQLRYFHDQLQLITRKLLQRWRKAADDGSAVDVASDLMRYTVDVTMLFALGHEANTLERGEDVIQRHLDKIFPALGRRVRAAIPYWRYFKLPRDRELDRALAALRLEVGRLIDQARARLRAAPDGAPTCFLEALLAESGREGATLSDEDVFANTMTVLLGGEDTTANTMAWLIHCLCGQPDVYAALRGEADALLDAPAAAADPEVPHAGSFPHWLRHTDSAINDTLRLYPVAPMIVLESLVDTVVDDVAVPAGTPVILLLRAAAASSPYSVPPPRFEPGQDAARADAGPGRAPTLPFGYGPRLCPGRNLALAELRSAALMLARNFNLEAMPQAEPVSELLSFTLVPKNLRVRLRRRAQKIGA